MYVIDSMEFDENMQSELSSFHPVHQRLLEDLLNQRGIGCLKRPIQINKFQRGGKDCGPPTIATDLDRNFFDKFLVQVPVCSDGVLEWRIALNEYSVNQRPDIKFYNDGFSYFLMNHFLLNKRRLFSYDSNQKNMLATVINEFRYLYFQYTLFSLKKESRCYDNVSAAIKMFHIRDFEIHQSDDLVHFTFPLDLDLSNVQLNIGESDRQIVIDFSVPYPVDSEGGYSSFVTINDKLKDELEMVRAKFPKFSRDKLICQHTQTVRSQLQTHVNRLSHVQTFRKTTLFELLAVSGVNVIQWDALQFKQMSFLYNIDSFYFIVHIDLTWSGIEVWLMSVYNSCKQFLHTFEYETPVCDIVLGVSETATKFRKDFVSGIYADINEVA